VYLWLELLDLWWATGDAGWVPSLDFDFTAMCNQITNLEAESQLEAKTGLSL
jgi:hypothetical protein